MPRRTRTTRDVPEPRIDDDAATRVPDDGSAQGTELAQEIVRLLEQRDVPSGAWLVDIARVRAALREADTLLRRLEEAIVRTAGASPPGGR